MNAASHLADRLIISLGRRRNALANRPRSDASLPRATSASQLVRHDRATQSTRTPDGAWPCNGMTGTSRTALGPCAESDNAKVTRVGDDMRRAPYRTASLSR